MHDSSAALTCPLVRRSQIEINENRCMTNLFLSTVSPSVFFEIFTPSAVGSLQHANNRVPKTFPQTPNFLFPYFSPYTVFMCFAPHSFPTLPTPPPSPPPRRHTRAFSTPLLHFRFLHARNPPLNRRTSLPSPPLPYLSPKISGQIVVRSILPASAHPPLPFLSLLCVTYLTVFYRPFFIPSPSLPLYALARC